MVTSVFTDGAYSNKSKVGGWGVVIMAAPLSRVRTLRGAVHGTTNNVMELTAILEAMRWQVRRRVDNVILHTDSQYAITVIQSSRVYEKNAALIEELRVLEDIRAKLCLSLDLRWVKGHGSSVGNIFADVIACRARDELAARLASEKHPS